MSATSAAGACASTAALSSKQSHGSAVFRAASVAPRGSVRARGASAAPAEPRRFYYTATDTVLHTPRDTARRNNHSAAATRSKDVVD